MTTTFNEHTLAAREIIQQVGKHVVIGVPLGLGKPIGLLNALYQLACDDPSIQLTIVTGLTFSRPTLTNELEKRLGEPILNRLLGSYVDPLYEKPRERQELPANIEVIEFFLSPGKFLGNAYVQQHYISSSYTNVVRDSIHLSINVLAQLVAPSPTHAGKYSLSCNTDLFHDTRAHLLQKQAAGQPVAVVAEVNTHLPYLYGEMAEIPPGTFNIIVDTKHYHTLFAIPRDEISIQDHLIGLYTSSLIKDDGCLQIGIGKLSNALANALIFRQQQNEAYQQLLSTLAISKKFGRSLIESGSLSLFDKGLYASTEMLSDEYLQLYQVGILKKRVYDHIGLQRLLNAKIITETITPAFLDILIEHHIIHANLTTDDVAFLQTFGILRLQEGDSIPLDLSNPTTKKQLIDHCLGTQLLCGKIIHAGFYFGSPDLYHQLRSLSKETLHQIEMTSIARTNSLLWSTELLTLQRKNARFVNSSLMVTLLGGAISDGLTNYQEVSGVGGQFDFVNMAAELPDARSIINCRSTRTTKHGVESNIIWDYTNSTLPRYLRDIIITEYGIADCRSKTDTDVIKAILNIADSRFQQNLLKQAKIAGKLAADYHIPAAFQDNYPDRIKQSIHTDDYRDYFKPYPFGSDLTENEQQLARALQYLQYCSGFKIVLLVICSLFFIIPDKNYAPYLLRMGLQQSKNIKDYFYKKLLKYSLYRTLD